MSILDRFIKRKQAPTQIVSIEQLSNFFGSSVAHYSPQYILKRYEKSLYVYASVNKIANGVIGTELRLYNVMNTAGELKEILESPVFDLLYKCNPYQTRSEFWKITVINKKIAGNAYWFKLRDEKGIVRELYNLRPDRVQIQSNGASIEKYIFTRDDGTQYPIEPTDIVHFREANPSDFMRGLSVIHPAGSRIETEEMATVWQRNFFKNNGRPDALLTTDGELMDEQRQELVSSWEKRHSGEKKNSRIGLLEGGLKYQQISLSQREMDYIESLKFTRDDILVAFGVPKSVITPDDINLANAQAGLQMFYSNTIKPEMQEIVEIINEMLIIPDFGDDIILDFDDPTPDDRAQKLNEYTQGVDKWITVNEIRADMGLPPVDGGDSLFRPFSVLPLDDAGTFSAGANALSLEVIDKTKKKYKPEVFRTRAFLYIKLQAKEEINDILAKEATKPKKKKVLKSLFEGEMRQAYADNVNKAIDKHSSKIKKALDKYVKEQEKQVLEAFDRENKKLKGKKNREKVLPDDIARWIDSAKETAQLVGIMFPIYESIVKEQGEETIGIVNPDVDFVMTQRIIDRINARASFMAGSVNETTFNKLAEQLAQGIQAGEGIDELRKRVQSTYDEFGAYRSELIARTETTAVNNEGFIEAYKQSRVVGGKEWVATLDDRTREEHIHLNGEIVGVNENFSNGLPYPQEPNCRCVIAPVVE